MSKSIRGCVGDTKRRSRFVEKEAKACVPVKRFAVHVYLAHWMCRNGRGKSLRSWHSCQNLPEMVYNSNNRSKVKRYNVRPSSDELDAAEICHGGRQVRRSRGQGPVFSAFEQRVNLQTKALPFLGPWNKQEEAPNAAGDIVSKRNET